MRLTGIIWMCPHCLEDFEVFCDDGRNDSVVCWNWCPHCKQKVNMWIRFKGISEQIKCGLTYAEANEERNK